MSDPQHSTPQRLSIVTLGVADVATSTKFYEQLGWKRAPASGPRITFIETDGSALALFEVGALADDAGVSADASARVPSPERFRGVALAICLDDEDRVDAAYQEWLVAGASPLVEPQKTCWGGYSSYVADPDGHVWELAHNPAVQIGAAGRITLGTG